MRFGLVLKGERKIEPLTKSFVHLRAQRVQHLPARDPRRLGVAELRATVRSAVDVVELVNREFVDFNVQIGHVVSPVFKEGSFPLNRWSQGYAARFVCDLMHITPRKALDSSAQACRPIAAATPGLTSGLARVGEGLRAGMGAFKRRRPAKTNEKARLVGRADRKYVLT